MITIVGPNEAPKESKFPFFVNTTSRSVSAFGREFSPFLIGPCMLWDGAPCVKSMTFENAWQFSKVYSDHVDQEGWPTDEWREWARKGFANKRAFRYPKGKGAKPEYSYWAGERLGYIEARKRIYIPLYKELIRPKDAFKELCAMYEKHRKLVLWDYDGYDRKKIGLSPEDVVNYPDRSMGHSFVIEQLLLEHFGGELSSEE